jgi:tRNA nucleotidyltransferase (CCA-adding enzyme)
MGKAIQPTAKKAVSQHLTSLVKVRPSLGGADLKAMGFAPGPLYRQILDRLMAARLDQEAQTREEELALVQREFGLHLQKEAS